MPEYAIVKDFSGKLWNSFLEKHSNGNFEQSFEYGEISKKAFPRSNVVRLACLRGNEPVGILQGIYSKYFGFGMSLGIMRGPVVNFDGTDYTHVVECLLRAIEDYARKNHVIEARVWVPQAWGVDAVFNSLGYSLVSRYNEYVVDLEKGIDDVWKSFSHNKRRNIKKALGMGVQVDESRRTEDLLTFYSMLTAAEKRGGFTSYPLSFFKAVWELYSPDLSKVFLARWNGKAVSGVFTVMHGKTVFALAAGSFSEGWMVRPNDIMHWKVMEWAMEKGYSRYQMGLVSDPPPSPESALWGIWRWKREWKGRLEKLNVFHKYFHQKYKLILKAKKFAEKTYQFMSRLG
ncbi:MAG: peptidoglycan bridge formation glycyltransferase FemA/FemB family protein [Candidatus Bathyarchaeia archaeon]